MKAVDNSCLDDPSRREVCACCFVWALLSGLTEPKDSCLDEADFSCLEEDFEDEDAEVDDADLARTFWTLLGTFPAEGICNIHKKDCILNTSIPYMYEILQLT